MKLELQRLHGGAQARDLPLVIRQRPAEKGGNVNRTQRNISSKIKLILEAIHTTNTTLHTEALKHQMSKDKD